MTNEEIRIKVVEAMGLKFVRAGHIKMPNAQEMWPDHWQDTRGKRKRIDGSIVGIPAALPNYPESPDACAEMVKGFNYDEADEFDDHLCDICKRDNNLADNPVPWRFAVTNATPSQRCLAYLKTKGIIP